MKGKYGGPMPVEDFYQALYQDRAFFDRHGITHIRAAYLYFTPCDISGEPVTIRDSQGNPMDGYISAGGYHSAADAYDAATLEPTPLSRRFTP
jgi:hypothetical protein